MCTCASRLLILSCSRRKQSDDTPLAAIDRYDGPAFRVLRRYLRSSPQQPPKVFILSAEYGLMPHNRRIPFYDRLMTPERARSLRPALQSMLQEILASGEFSQLLISAGKVYIDLLAAAIADAKMPSDVRILGGSQGRKLTELRAWLYGEPTATRGQQLIPTARGSARLRGIRVAMTSSEVLDVGRHRLAEAPHRATTIQTWYVPIDGHRVAPKWLVGQLTGLPPAAFVSDEARRLLAQLGVEVHHV
jgi:hypothetical protein